jgi:hypothetical protein
MRRLLLTVGVVLACASCGVRPAAAPSAGSSSSTPSGSAPSSSTAPSSPSSGSIALVSGVVETGSGCPVQRLDSRCAARRLGNVQVEAWSLSAGVTASTRTSGDGHYSFRLQQGRYMLTVAPGQAVPRCSVVQVSITSQSPIQADIHCDSGIR